MSAARGSRIRALWAATVVACVVPCVAGAAPVAFEITGGEFAGDAIIGGGQDIVLEFNDDFSTLQLQEFDFEVSSRGLVSLPVSADSLFSMSVDRTIVYSFGGFDVEIAGVTVSLSSAQVGFDADSTSTGAPSTMTLFGNAQIAGGTQGVTFRARMIGDAVSGTLPIPEPSSAMLFGLGLVLVGQSVRRRPR